MGKCKVIVWCADCGNDQDPNGCFDGGSETYEERFSSREEAEQFVALKRREMGAPWRYDIEEDRPETATSTGKATP